MVAEEELRFDRNLGALLDHWGTPSSPEAKNRRLDKYAAVFERAQQAETFTPLEMPDARCPPDGELLLAWALHRANVRLARYPEWATSDSNGQCLGRSSSECTIYRGPLELSGTVTLSGTVVIVGNLVVDGHLVDGWASDSALVVIGDETVRAFDLSSDHLVTGNLSADVLRLGPEAAFSVAGALSTKLVVQSASFGTVPSESMPRVVDPEDLEALRACFEPTPGASLDADELIERFARRAHELKVE